PAPDLKRITIKTESTIKNTRIITTGTTTKIKPGGNTLATTTRARTNTRRRARRSSRNTGITATLIQTKTSNVTHIERRTQENKNSSGAERYGAFKVLGQHKSQDLRKTYSSAGG